MGKFKPGALGKVRGKVGDFVISKWKDQVVVRERPEASTKPLTQPQIEARARFAVAGAFTKKLKRILRICNNPASMTSQNIVMKQIVKYAMVGVYPNFTIDFSMVKLSFETGVAKAKTPAAVSNDPGKIHFSWTASITGGAQASDKALIVAYCESLNQVEYQAAAAQRSAAFADLDVQDFSGLPVHTWIVFISEDAKEVSDSIYTGIVNVQ